VVASSEPPGVSNELRVPRGLWRAIEHRLDNADAAAANQPAALDAVPACGTARPFWSRRWALAASLVFVAGLGAIGLSVLDTPADAASINFRVLLDALPVDPVAAFDKFLRGNGATEAPPEALAAFAPDLDFAVPPTLPGGFQRTGTYTLSFGSSPGVAASYDRDGEFLAVIFHPPIYREDFGTHKDMPCAVGKHRGHKVVVGDWKMIHLTTPSTCHCLLSRLDESTELSAVMSAVAPGGLVTVPHHHDP